MRKIIFTLSLIIVAFLSNAQQLYKSRSIGKLDTNKSIYKWKENEENRLKELAKDSISKTTSPSDDDEENKYPRVSVLGSGSLSGNIDSTVAAAAKLHVVFMPTDRWTIYGAINKGLKSDTIALNHTPPIRNLLFPDANNIGYQIGIAHTLRLKTWEGGSRIMDLNFVPFGEYLLQRRAFISMDSAGVKERSFYASNLLLGAGLELNYFNDKNVISIDFKAGYSRLNIANNDVDDFRGVFSNLVSQTGVSLDDEYTGLFFQSAIKINGAGLFYKYAALNAGNELQVKGLTGGQHFFGIILSAEIWEK